LVVSFAQRLALNIVILAYLMLYVITKQSLPERSGNSVYGEFTNEVDLLLFRVMPRGVNFVLLIDCFRHF